MATAISGQCLPRRAARAGGACANCITSASLRFVHRGRDGGRRGNGDYLDQVESGMSERAVLAGGVSWGMQELIRHKPGVSPPRGLHRGRRAERDLPQPTAPMPRGSRSSFDPEVISYR